MQTAAFFNCSLNGSKMAINTKSKVYASPNLPDLGNDTTMMSSGANGSIPIPITRVYPGIAKKIEGLRVGVRIRVIVRIQRVRIRA
jgi:hypothetical protein